MKESVEYKQKLSAWCTNGLLERAKIIEEISYSTYREVLMRTF